MQIAVYYDVVYCTLHYDVIRPNFTCALITEHIHVLNTFQSRRHILTHCKKVIYLRIKMKSFRAKFAKTASIKVVDFNQELRAETEVSLCLKEATASG